MNNKQRTKHHSQPWPPRTSEQLLVPPNASSASFVATPGNTESRSVFWYARSCQQNWRRRRGHEGGGGSSTSICFCLWSLSSLRTQLDLLDQLAGSTSDLEGYESESNPVGPTIREQLARLVRDREGNFSIPLGKNLKKVSEKLLNVSQKRNIKRQAYLDEVSQRNDSVFFATIGAFVILPPFVILGIAVLTGYVQLFP